MKLRGGSNVSKQLKKWPFERILHISNWGVRILKWSAGIMMSDLNCDSQMGTLPHQVASSRKSQRQRGDNERWFLEHEIKWWRMAHWFFASDSTWGLKICEEEVVQNLQNHYQINWGRCASWPCLLLGAQYAVACQERFAFLATSNVQQKLQTHSKLHESSQW